MLLQSGVNIYYKMGQLFLLQSEANCVTKWGSSFITKWGRFYYKVGQVLLQSGAGITKWGIITKWCITMFIYIYTIFKGQ